MENRAQEIFQNNALLCLIMFSPRPSSAPARRSAAAVTKAKQLPPPRATRPPSNTASAPSPSQDTFAAKHPKLSRELDAFDQEVSGTISRLRGVSGWNWGEKSFGVSSSRHSPQPPALAIPCATTANLFSCSHPYTGVYAGIELRSYSIAARALWGLVVEATSQPQSSSPQQQRQQQQLSSRKTSHLPHKAPDPPLAHAGEEVSKVTTDLNALLKHIQRSSSL